MKLPDGADELRLLAVSYERLAERLEAAAYPPQETQE
jgi:hypothetical protein